MPTVGEFQGKGRQSPCPQGVFQSNEEKSDQNGSLVNLLKGPKLALAFLPPRLIIPPKSL